MNKKISFPIAIIIIVVCAILAGFLIWYYNLIPEISWPMVLSPKRINEVTITTDKTEYTQGELGEITIINGLDKPIWYMWNKTEEYPWWSLQKKENETWENLDFLKPTSLANGEVKCLPLTAGGPEEKLWTELKQNTQITDGWDFKYCPIEDVVQTESGFDPEFIDAGAYRFSFDYAKDKNAVSSGKEEFKTIYSNEFTIKEGRDTQIDCQGTCRCMQKCNESGPTYFIALEEGAWECSVNSVNKTCCCSVIE